MKERVYALARELEVSSADLLTMLRSEGAAVASASSTVDPALARAAHQRATDAGADTKERVPRKESRRVPSAPDSITRDNESRQHRRLFEHARRSVVRVDHPLVLIGQIQRSGGTLLNSLFDGHPALLTHPFQLQIGHPKYEWPDPGAEVLADPKACLECFRTTFIDTLFAKGYAKSGKGYIGDRLPFMVVPSFFNDLFVSLHGQQPPTNSRELMNLFSTAFFNAWLDLQGLRTTPKRWVVGFSPRLGWRQPRVGFWNAYPDGRLIMVARDPRAWYSSEARLSDAHDKNWLRLWRLNAKAIITAKQQRPKAVFALTYEHLVQDPATTMRELAKWLEIEYDEILTQPTFNRQLTSPNSSYGVEGTGVRPELAERWRSELTPATIELIETETDVLWSRTLEVADLAHDTTNFGTTRPIT